MKFILISGNGDKMANLGYIFQEITVSRNFIYSTHQRSMRKLQYQSYY